eukprot:scaffold20314_cov56-Isochrysis_galbana.AAC.1
MTGSSVFSSTRCVRQARRNIASATALSLPRCPPRPTILSRSFGRSIPPPSKPPSAITDRRSRPKSASTSAVVELFLATAAAKSADRVALTGMAAAAAGVGAKAEPPPLGGAAAGCDAMVDWTAVSASRAPMGR